MNENNDYILICSEPAVVEINKNYSLLRINGESVSCGDLQWEILIALTQHQFVPPKRMVDLVTESPLRDYKTPSKLRIYAAISELKKKFKRLIGIPLITCYTGKGYSFLPPTEERMARVYAGIDQCKYRIVISEELLKVFFEDAYFKMLDEIAKNDFLKKKISYKENPNKWWYQKNLKKKIKRRKFSYEELLGLFRSVIIRG